MKYFVLSKYQTKYENPLYLAKQLYELLVEPMNIDQVVTSLERHLGVNLSTELEGTIYLSLAFLYAVGMVEYIDNNVRRIN